MEHEQRQEFEATMLKKNTRAVEQTINSHAVLISELQAQITGLINSISTLNNKQTEIEQNINLIRAKQFNSGPTAR